MRSQNSPAATTNTVRWSPTTSTNTRPRRGSTGRGSSIFFWECRVNKGAKEGAKASHGVVDNGEEEKISHASQNDIQQSNIDEENMRCDEGKDETKGAENQDETRVPRTRRVRTRVPGRAPRPHMAPWTTATRTMTRRRRPHTPRKTTHNSDKRTTATPRKTTYNNQT